MGKTRWIVLGLVCVGALVGSPGVGAQGDEPDAPGPAAAEAADTPDPGARTDAFNDGFKKGEEAAREEQLGVWAYGGLASGFFCGPCGCAVPIAGYLVPPPTKMKPIGDERPEFQRGYEQGFEKAIKMRRAKTAGVGVGLGFVGLAIVGTILIFVFELDDDIARGDLFNGVRQPTGIEIRF